LFKLTRDFDSLYQHNRNKNYPLYCRPIQYVTAKQKQNYSKEKMCRTKTDSFSRTIELQKK